MVGYVILGAFALLLAVLLLRAAAFRPKAQNTDPGETVTVDQAAVTALQRLVQCKTISYNDPTMEDEGEFQKLIALLPELYPNVFKACTLQQLPDRALLFHWKGKAADKPSVMMAHYDVVPVNEDGWEKPPFDGIIEDGILWGRGTLDTKATFNGVLYAANTLIGEGFVPEQDVYFAFSGGEEVNGKGALNIVNYFKEKGIDVATN